MPETSIIARARHAFRNLANGMYLSKREDVIPFFDQLLPTLDELPDVVSLELCAKWEQLKPHYEAIGGIEQAKTVDTVLRERALRYLNTASSIS